MNQLLSIRDKLTATVIMAIGLLTIVAGEAKSSKELSNRFFPMAISQERDTWYSKHLNAMHEPMLYHTTSQKSVYRFLWLPSRHNPVCVRLRFISNNKSILIVKKTNGAGGYQPGELITDEKLILSKTDTSFLRQKVNAAMFWQTPTVESNPGGEDGTQWIFEGVRGKTYHVVDRWEPEPQLKDLGLALLRISQLKDVSFMD